MEKRQKKEKVQKLLFTIAFIVYSGIIGGFGGFVLGDINEAFFSQKETGILEIAIVIAIVLILAVVSFYLHIYIHETGHLICGLITGYSFQSIRFGSFMLVKNKEGFHWRRLKLAGTGGQCLMIPPKMDGDYFPTSLYNWGGCIGNGIVTFLGFLGYGLVDKSSVLTVVFVIFALVGLGVVLMNGIPFSSLSNDGYNAGILKKDAKTRRAFWVQLNINNSLSEGKGIKDMPTDWFEWEEEVPENNLTAAMGIMRFSYLVEKREFSEARRIGTFLLKNAETLANIHEILLKGEMLFCGIILEEEKDKLRESFHKEKKELEVLKTQPSMQRIFYTYYLVVEEDESKAKEALKLFEKMANKYPYPVEIQSERELIALADEKAGLQKNTKDL